MHVEFIGIPSSGKSTIIKSLASTYPDKYVLAEKKHISIRTLLLNNPLLSLSVLIKIMPIASVCIKAAMTSDVKSKSKMLSLIGVFLNLANYLDKNQNKSVKKIILWDELLHQRALSVFAYSTNTARNSDIQNYVRWAEKTTSTTVVGLEVLTNIKERLFQRGLPTRFKEFNDVTIMKIIDTQLVTAEMIFSESTTCFRLTAEGNVESCAAKAHEYILKKRGKV